MQKEALHSKKLIAGRKTYFFDVRETGSGDKYLHITESRFGEGGEKVRHDITIFEDQIDKFSQVLEEMRKFLE